MIPIDTQSRIQQLETEIKDKRNELLTLLKQSSEVSGSYVFEDVDGEKVALDTLFGESDEMMVIQNMGKSCVYCTLWADGLNGILPHLENRVPVIFVTPDDFNEAKAFAHGRDWNFRVLSSRNNSFKKDTGFETASGSPRPGVAILKREDGKITQTAYDNFGPGDMYSPLWHLFDLLEKGANDWRPKYQYN